MSKALAKSGVGGRALAKKGDFKSQLAEYAKADSAREPVGGGGNSISIKGKNFSYQGNNLSEPLKVIVIRDVFENAFYTSGFDEDNMTPPACFAIAEREEDMAPHESSPEPQAENCRDCPRNQWGTADKGKGKACKNNRRLAVISAETDDIDVDYLKTQDIALIRLPPTSVKNLRGYKKKIQDGLKMPLWSVISSLSFDEDAAYPVVIPEFTGELELDKKAVAVLLARVEECATMLLQPFDVTGYQAPGGKKAKSKPAPARNVGKPSKTPSKNGFGGGKKKF